MPVSRAPSRALSSNPVAMSATGGLLHAQRRRLDFVHRVFVRDNELLGEVASLACSLASTRPGARDEDGRSRLLLGGGVRQFGVSG